MGSSSDLATTLYSVRIDKFQQLLHRERIRDGDWALVDAPSAPLVNASAKLVQVGLLEAAGQAG